MLLQYKNEITILYRCGCCNAYFETKRSGRNDGQNKLDKERKTDLVSSCLFTPRGSNVPAKFTKKDSGFFD